MRKEIDYTLYLCTDRKQMTTETLEEAVRLAVQGGVTLVQLREKNCSSREFYQVAKSIKKVTDSCGVPLLINDRLDIALAVDADGVHLGQTDLPVDAARRVLGPEKIIGATANTLARAEEAWRAGADYLGAGDVFGTSTKADTVRIRLEELEQITKHVEIPVVAIGGIAEENIGKLRKTGVKGAAVISAVLAQKDITMAARRLISNFREG